MEEREREIVSLLRAGDLIFVVHPIPLLYGCGSLTNRLTFLREIENAHPRTHPSIHPSFSYYQQTHQ